MPLNNTALDAGANHLATLMTHLALHTADPGATGTNPASSARVTAAWTPASGNGNLVATNKNFTGGAANGACTYVGFWSAITGGTFYGSQILTGDTTFNSAGEYTITSLTVDGNSP